MEEQTNGRRGAKCLGVPGEEEDGGTRVKEREDTDGEAQEAEGGKEGSARQALSLRKGGRKKSNMCWAPGHSTPFCSLPPARGQKGEAKKGRVHCQARATDKESLRSLGRNPFFGQ